MRREAGNGDKNEAELPARIGGYRILHRLGAGSRGVVYAAMDDRSGRRVAVRKIDAAVRASSASEDPLRAVRELTAVRQINVCEIREIGEDERGPFLVMDLLEGRPLSQRLAEGPIPPPEALRIVHQILDGLSAIHGCGLFHGDLSPAHVILTPEGAKLLDFGLTGLGPRPPSREPPVPCYLAPEQLNGEPGDERSDLFAVGAILFEMLAGRPAFPGPDPNSPGGPMPGEALSVPTLPPACEGVALALRRALERNPEMRTSSASRMAADLEGELRPDAGREEAAEGAVLGPTVELTWAPGRARQAPEILGSYRILNHIASGASGAVYRAERCEAGPSGSPVEQVAIKILDPLLLEKEGILERFRQEAEIGRTVASPHVVRVLEVGRAGDRDREFHYIVMEFVEGQTLRGLLQEMGRVPDALCRQIALEAVLGLSAVHGQGIVHRDLKPENVQITSAHTVKIMDLGVALVKDRANRLTQAGHFLGSIPYASPEQLRGDPLDTRSDLFSLGVILYELAAGVHPFARGDLPATMRALLEEAPRRPGEINSQLSPFLDALIMTLLAKKPEERFESAGLLVEVLHDAERSAWWKRCSGELPAALRRPLRRLRIPREAGFQGRERELGLLRERLERVRAGAGQVVLLEGEPGIGKSRLIDEFVRGLEEVGTDLNFLYGAFPSGGLAALSDAFGAAVLEHLGPADLEARLLGHLPGMQLIVLPFASWLRGDPSPGNQAPLGLPAAQAAFAQLLKSLSQERPTVLVIEDLDYAPKQGRLLFTSLARAIQFAPVLLVGTTCAVEGVDWPVLLSGMPHVSHTTLSRLGAKDLQRLLQEVLRSETLAEDLGSGIALKSDGNPLFALAILQSLRESHLIEQRDDGSWRRLSSIRTLEIPSGVRELIASRLAGLEEADRDVLEAAACLGHAFDPLLVAEALKLERIPLLKQLGRLERTRKLVRAVGRQFEFDQHQIQEQLYEGLSVPLREEYHALLGAAIEARACPSGRTPEQVGGETAVLLCKHFLRGGCEKGALRYSKTALLHLERTSQCALFVEFADLVLALGSASMAPGEHAGLLIRKARALNMIGDGQSALAVLEEAKVLAQQANDPAASGLISIASGEVFLSRWEAEPARARYQEALDFASAAGNRALQIQALNGLGSSCIRLGRHEEALQFHERARLEALSIGDPAGEADALEGKAKALLNLCRLEESRCCRELAIKMFSAQGNRAAEASALTNLGVFQTRMGDYEKAAEYFSGGASVFRGLGHALNEALATENWARAQACLGHYGEALLRSDRCITIYREVGNAQKTGLALNQMATWLAFLADFDAARTCLEEAKAILLHLDLIHRVGESLNGLAFVAEQEGSLSEALELYRVAMAHCSDKNCGARSEAGLYTARLLIRQGCSGFADERLDELEGVIDPARTPELFVLMQAYRALLHPDRLPATLESYAALEKRLEFRTRLECRLLHWKVSARAEHLAEARALMSDMEAHIPAALREKAVAQISLYREIRAAQA